MATSQVADVQHDPASEAQPATRKNSPLTYGLGALGLMAIGQAFGGYYQFYYVDVLGLAVALLATINIVYGIWDIVNNPLAGYLSDNTRARWGRRRPWLLAALPFTLAFLVLAYAVPAPFRQGSALFWYALGIVFLQGVQKVLVELGRALEVSPEGPDPGGGRDGLLCLEGHLGGV